MNSKISTLWCPLGGHSYNVEGFPVKGANACPDCDKKFREFKKFENQKLDQSWSDQPQGMAAEWGTGIHPMEIMSASRSSKRLSEEEKEEGE